MSEPKGHVKIYKTVDGVKSLVHSAHNVITYKGREVLSNRAMGTNEFSHWGLHLGTGWVGYFGEPDPAITQLYTDYSSLNPDATGETYIYSMNGRGSQGNGYNYPILSVDYNGVPAQLVVTPAQTVVDPRVGEINNSVLMTCTIGPFPLGTISGAPLNEMGLYYSPTPLVNKYVTLTEINENEDAVLFAYEPITNAIMVGGIDTLTVEWEISF